MWLDDDPEPVHGNCHDGERGHEGGYAGEGLNQSGKYKFYFQVDKLSLRAIYNYWPQISHIWQLTSFCLKHFYK